MITYLNQYKTLILTRPDKRIILSNLSIYYFAYLEYIIKQMTHL